eukprot:16714-Chlamydomonas_euryale.AAC.3
MSGKFGLLPDEKSAQRLKNSGKCGPVHNSLYADADCTPLPARLDAPCAQALSLPVAGPSMLPLLPSSAFAANGREPSRFGAYCPCAAAVHTLHSRQHVGKQVIPKGSPSSTTSC